MKTRNTVIPSDRRIGYWGHRTIRNISFIKRKDRIKFGVWNARSVNNKVDFISDIVISNNIDIFTITETWITQGKEHSVCMLRDLLPGYKLKSLPRATRGGGLALLYRSDFNAKLNGGQSYVSFEF